MEEVNIENLVNKSLEISLAKKNIFDISVKTLDRLRIRVKDSILMDTINGVSLRKFKDLLAEREDEEKYLKRLEEIVKSVLTQYMKQYLELSEQRVDQ